jgi:hypothetical protein
LESAKNVESTFVELAEKYLDGDRTGLDEETKDGE